MRSGFRFLPLAVVKEESENQYDSKEYCPAGRLIARRDFRLSLSPPLPRLEPLAPGQTGDDDLSTADEACR